MVQPSRQPGCRPGYGRLEVPLAVEFQRAFSVPYPQGSCSDRLRYGAMNEATIRLHIEKLDDGGFLATNVDVPGLVAEGRSVAEVTEIAQGLARKIAESYVEHGDPLPPALTDLVQPAAGIDLLVPVSVP